MPLRVSLIHQFEQQKAETVDLRFSFDGKRLVSSDGNELYLWRLSASGRWEYERLLPFHQAVKPSFTLDNRRLAFRNQEGIFQLISLEDEEEIRTLPSAARANCTFSLDQRWLVTGDANSNLLLWNLSTYQWSTIPLALSSFAEKSQSMSTEPLSEAIECIQFIPDGQRLALGVANTAGYGGIYICNFDPANKKLLQQATFPHGCLDLAVSPDGMMLATIDARPERGPVQEIYIYDLQSYQLLHIFPQKGQDCYCLLAFSPDSQLLVGCKDNGEADLFSLKPFKLIASFAAHPNLASYAEPIGGLDWSKTGYIATGGAGIFEEDMERADYSIKIWKVETA